MTDKIKTKRMFILAHIFIGLVLLINSFYLLLFGTGGFMIVGFVGLFGAGECVGRIIRKTNLHRPLNKEETKK